MIFTIFKKELKETLRDRKALIRMLLIPVLLFPVIIKISTGISTSFQEKESAKKLKIGIIAQPDNLFVRQLAALPDQLGKKAFIFYADTNLLKKDIESGKIDAGVLVPEQISERLTELKSVQIKYYYNGTSLSIQSRLEKMQATINTQITQERLNKLHLSLEVVTPYTTAFQNVASDQQMIGKIAGGFLPYIFIAFGFMGCMYPAIDLFTGEKERGTIETLLTTPVKRWQILIGKMGVVVLSGLLSASAALFGLYIAFNSSQDAEMGEIMQIINHMLSPSFILLLFSMLVPLTVFFAGMMIPVTVRAKSFKEAQSLVTPMNMLVILPAMVGLFPGIEYNATTAAIPIINIVLAIKELIAGTLNYGLLAISYAVMLLLAVAAVLLSYKQFDKETNIVN